MQATKLAVGVCELSQMGLRKKMTELPKDWNTAEKYTKNSMRKSSIFYQLTWVSTICENYFRMEI